MKEAESGEWSSDVTAGAMVGICPPEARDPEARGMGRRERIGRQDMEEDGDEQERSDNVSVKQGQKRHRRISREVKWTK